MRSLNSLFPGWISGNGIFSKLALLNVPWPTSISGALDMEYHGNISGKKPVAPLVTSLLGDNETLTEEQKAQLAGVIYAMCGDIWEKEYATLSYTYDPIENYSMIETMSNDNTTRTYGKTHTRTDNLAHSETGGVSGTDSRTIERTPNLSEARTLNTTDTDTRNYTDTETKNLTSQETKNLSDGADDITYGFNSSTGVPSTGRTETHTGTDTTTETGTDATAYTGTDTVTHTGTDTLATTGTDRTTDGLTTSRTNTVTGSNTGTVGDVDGGTDQETHSYTLTRSGNIGVTTSQQMIQSERDLDLWNFFYSVVFPSVDKVLTLMIYD